MIPTKTIKSYEYNNAYTFKLRWIYGRINSEPESQLNSLLSCPLRSQEDIILNKYTFYLLYIEHW